MATDRAEQSTARRVDGPDREHGEEWSQHWLKSRHGLTAKTRDGYESLLRSRILPTFGRTEIRHIMTPAVRQWVSEMVEDLSPARIKQALQVLHASLDMAVDDGLTPRNPTETPSGGSASLGTLVAVSSTLSHPRRPRGVMH